MVDQVLKATRQASTAVDNALEFVDASNQRIATMEAKRGIDKYGDTVVTDTQSSTASRHAR